MWHFRSTGDLDDQLIIKIKSLDDIQSASRSISESFQRYEACHFNVILLLCTFVL